MGIKWAPPSPEELAARKAPKAVDKPAATPKKAASKEE
jgi:hypothetical protein